MFAGHIVWGCIAELHISHQLASVGTGSQIGKVQCGLNIVSAPMHSRGLHSTDAGASAVPIGLQLLCVSTFPNAIS